MGVRSGGGRAARPSQGSSSWEGTQPPANSLALPSSHPQSPPCRHPLHLAVQRHPRFRGLFNFSAPVLLSGGVFTQELWDQLRQHKAPYGWQGLSHQGDLRPLPAARPSGLSWSLLSAFGLVRARHPPPPSALTARDAGTPCPFPGGPQGSTLNLCTSHFCAPKSISKRGLAAHALPLPPAASLA